MNFKYNIQFLLFFLQKAEKGGRNYGKYLSGNYRYRRKNTTSKTSEIYGRKCL